MSMPCYVCEPQIFRETMCVIYSVPFIVILTSRATQLWALPAAIRNLLLRLKLHLIDVLPSQMAHECSWYLSFTNLTFAIQPAENMQQKWFELIVAWEQNKECVTRFRLGPDLLTFILLIFACRLLITNYLIVVICPLMSLMTSHYSLLTHLCAPLKIKKRAMYDSVSPPTGMKNV